jgi:hypothetical protein
MSSRPYTATEFGRLFGNAWAGWAPWPEVVAVRRGDRRASSLRDLVAPQVVAEIHQFGYDRTQAEAEFWEGFVAGVNELVEGSLDSQDLLRGLEEQGSLGANEFQIDDE